jgi:Flp pilus assembly protein TadG
MSSHKGILRRFASDRKGNVSLMFAVSLIPMVGAAGAAIDYATASNARAKMQSALDAGAIAAAKDFTVLSSTQIKERVESFLTTLPSSQFSAQPSVSVLSNDPNIVSVTASACVKTVFNGVVAGVNPCVHTRADVERPTENYLEIALVLDNSGSMSGSKIDAAKTAAKNFTNSVFNGNSDPQKVKVSVVPFTLTVNAGAGMNIASDPNLDRNGQSSIHWENLLPVGTAPPAGVTSRFSLYQQLGETWTGCLEMRPGAWGLNDAAPTAAVGDSLFVPMFAPDEPGPRGATWVRENLLNQQGSGSTDNLNNSYLNDDGSETLSYDWATGKENGATRSACTPPISTNFSLPFASPTASWQEKNWLNRSTANICRYNLVNTSGGASGRKSISNTGGIVNGAGRGPNYMCNARPLQRLSATQGNAISKINEMTADGNTNILEGLMWGWRTISPNAPFADGRAYNWNSQTAIGPGSQIRNRKFIILMTDGDNYWAGQSNPNGSIYSPFGYYRNNRLQATINNDWDATLAMNAKARTACDNIKTLRDKDNNEAVKIITIGFSTPGQQISSTGLQLLQDCASMEGGQRLFYTATNASELNQVFALIASNIGKLKLSR